MVLIGVDHYEGERKKYSYIYVARNRKAGGGDQ